jgi:hypothetical protein
MGKAAFSGPVYGGKGNLFSVGPVAAASASTTLVASIVVPPYETWYLTELFAAQSQASSNSSTPKIVLKVKGTSTSVSYPGPGPDPAFPTGNAGTVATVTGPTSTATWNQVTTATATAGEYEGYAAPANSTIRIVSSGTIGLLSARVNGFIRFIDSTRAS